MNVKSRNRTQNGALEAGWSLGRVTKKKQPKNLQLGKIADVQGTESGAPTHKENHTWTLPSHTAENQR